MGKSRSLFRRILCVVVAVVLGMTTVFSVFAAEESADTGTDTSTVYLQQAEALEAYSQLCSLFEVDDAGYVTYPDDYAGAWIDENKLYIAIVPSVHADSLSETSVSVYTDLLQDYDCVVYQPATYSLNDLNAIRYSVCSELMEEQQIVCHYVDVEKNKIEIGFSDYDENEVWSSISAITSELSATSDFSVSTGAKDGLNYADLFEFYEEEEFVSEASIYGGMEIHQGSSSGYGRSIGVCGTFTSNGTTYNGIITAGHELATSGTDQTIYRNGSEFGKVSLLMWRDGASGDWACVRLTNSDTITNKIYGSSSSMTRNITGTLDDLPVGTAVMKYGYASGYAEATVTAQNVTVTQDSSGYTINGLTRATLTSGSSTGGDSGGPYYTQNSSGGNSYNFVGVHYGSNTSSGGSSILFTPYVRFKSSFTVKTS